MGEAQGICGWGVAGLGWVAGDFIVPAMVQQKTRLAGCVGSTPEKSQSFAQRFGFGFHANRALSRYYSQTVIFCQARLGVT